MQKLKALIVKKLAKNQTDNSVPYTKGFMTLRVKAI
jgi:hypothetical protein